MGNLVRLTICSLVLVALLSPGLRGDASAFNHACFPIGPLCQLCQGLYGGNCPGIPDNTCPTGWFEEYDTVKHQPPSIASVVSRCGGPDGMIWAEVPESADDMVFGPKHVNNLRIRYGYYQDTLVTVETQVPLRALTTFEATGGGIGTLEVIKGAPVDHIDVVYSPGHRGLPEPHLDIREQLVEHTAHQAFECQPTKGGWFKFLRVSQ